MTLDKNELVMPTVRRAVLGDARAIGALHLEMISKGFLSSLGQAKLCFLYEILISDAGTLCFVAVWGNKVVGFVCGTTSLKQALIRCFKKDSCRILGQLCTRMLHPVFLWKLLEILIYSIRDKNKWLPKHELISIAVKPPHQKQGVGQQLFQALKNEWQCNGIESFKVAVGASLERACRFYEKMGGQKQDVQIIHYPEKTIIYVFSG